jgi:hypothetical protein
VKTDVLLYDAIGEQIEQLIPLFGVDAQRSNILTAFETACRDSLCLHVGEWVPELSRINVDGTPFQYSLSLRRNRPAALQFLAEAARPGLGTPERIRAGSLALHRLAETCGVGSELETVVPLLSVLAPEADPSLLADPSGALWLALSFERDAPPALTVYVNAQWGSEPSRWRRLHQFAEFFESGDEWRWLVPFSGSGRTPLGTAVTFRAGKETMGRIYLWSYGLGVDAHRLFFLRSPTGEGASNAFDRFTRHILGDDVCYPTRSSLVSMEMPAKVASAKVELCAHCACAHDVEAAARLSAWLRDAGLDEDVYGAMMSVLTARRQLSGRALPSVHAYVGVGWRGGEEYASIYVNPGPGLECW